jgi:RNA polymerase sigma factor (sigma-70 family)
MEPEARRRRATGVTAARSVVAPVDPGDFASFYRARWNDAVRLAFVISGDPTIAEDVAQESLARVQARFDQLLDPWPYTRMVVVNGCRSWARVRAREAARFRLLGPSPTECDQQVLELLGSIDRLPFRQKAVIVLRYYEDLSEQEIADALGCRPGTVKSLASRALARLATEVER